MKYVQRPTAPKPGETIRAQISVVEPGDPNRYPYAYMVELSNGEYLCSKRRYPERSLAVDAALEALRYWGYGRPWFFWFLGKRAGWRRTGSQYRVAACELDAVIEELALAEMRAGNADPQE